MPKRKISRTIGGVTLHCASITLWSIVVASCAGATNGPTKEPTTDAITSAAPTAAAVAPPAVDAAATPDPSLAAPVAALPDDNEDIEEPAVAIEPDRAPPPVSPANIAPEASELALVELAVPSTEELEPAAPVSSHASSLVASPISAETLDFSSLVSRLRKTKAINLRTKVGVKSESDDLLEQARAYHTQSGETTLADLRRSYDLLFQRLHTLLEDADPPLARDIDRSSDAIWELLADPSKFNASI